MSKQSFYTEKQKQWFISSISQIIILFGCLLMAKLSSNSPFKKVSWWVVTAPIWVTVCIALATFLGVILLYIGSEIIYPSKTNQER